HRIEGLEKQNLPRVGPSLEKVSAKVSKDWAARWVMDPASFRPNTKMPSFFYQENFINVSGEKKPTKAQQEMNVRGKLENDAMVNSIVTYLFEKSRPAAVSSAPGGGDKGRGEKLLAARGCFGCHHVGPAPRSARRPNGHLPPVGAEPRRYRREGVPRLDLPVDNGPEEVEPRDEDAEPAAHPAGRLGHRGVPLDAEGARPLRAGRAAAHRPEGPRRHRFLLRDPDQDALRRAGGPGQDGPPRQGGLR